MTALADATDPRFTDGQRAQLARFEAAEVPAEVCRTCRGRIRETVGMVCQTCGTDYAPVTGVDLDALDKLRGVAAAYEKAAAAYLEASEAYEAALMSTGAPRESDAAERYRRAANESAAALQALVRARKAQVPGFEALLTDPTVQADPHCEVLDSIRAYSAALSASAGMPLARPRHLCIHGHTQDDAHVCGEDR